MTAPYGFRVVGASTERRRLVDADAAFSGYAQTADAAEVDREGYLSAFQFGGEFRDHRRLTGSTKRYKGICWAKWLWFDVDREDDMAAAAKDARRLAAGLVDRYGSIRHRRPI